MMGKAGEGSHQGTCRKNPWTKTMELGGGLNGGSGGSRTRESNGGGNEDNCN